MQTDIYWALTKCQELYTRYCDGKNLGVDAKYLIFFLSSVNSCVNGKTHTSFPSLCLLIYKVGKMTSRGSDKKQDVKTLLNPWYSIISEDLPSWYLHNPFEIHIICNAFFNLMTYKCYICMCLHMCTHIFGCEYIHIQVHIRIHVYSQLEEYLL